MSEDGRVMSGRAGPSAGDRRLAYLPVAVALLAEAAWIAVFAGLLEAFALHEPVTGIAELLLAAVLGAVAARFLPDRVGGAWSWIVVGLAAVAGAVGWLASGEVRAILAAGGTGAIGPALAANPGGWLAGLAFVRGVAYARPPVEPGRIATLLALAVPALALAAIVGGMITEPWRSTFLATAEVQVLIFLSSCVLALALGRLTNVGRGSRVDWRRNPAWLALAGGLVLGTMAVAALIAATVGHAIAMALAAVTVPLLMVGFAVGFDRRSIRIVLVSLAAVGIIGTVLRIVAPNGPAGTPGPAPVPPSVPGTQPDPGTAAIPWIVAGVLVLAIAAVVVLARLWLRRTRVEQALDDEVRFIDHGGPRDDPSRPRRASRFRRRVAPVDAVAAYRSLLDDIGGRRPVAREAGETPSEHARRLRTAGHGGLALELLAADYGLARFGGVELSDAETRRAIGRAERLRRVLLRVPVEAGEGLAAGAPGTGAAGERAPGMARGSETDGPDGRRGGRRGQGLGADHPDADEPATLGSILTRIRRGP